MAESITDVTLTTETFTSVSIDEGGGGQGLDTSGLDSLPLDYSNTSDRPPYVALTEVT